MKWILFNFITGDIIGEFPLSEDQVSIDVNNTDTGSLTIPGYFLSEGERENFTTLNFKPYSRGVALAKDDEVWNSSRALLTSGVITKWSYSLSSETYTLTFESPYQYLLKIGPYSSALWAEEEDLESEINFEAGTYGGLMWKILQYALAGNGISSPPAGWVVPQIFTSTVSTTGTGKTWVEPVDSMSSVATIWEKLRDGVDSNGEEFRFIPQYTSSAKTKIKIVVDFGTSTAPHLNFNASDPFILDPQNTGEDWEVSEITLDNDYSFVANKWIVSGEVVKTSNKFSTTAYPALIEIDALGDSVEEASVDKRLTERMDRSEIPAVVGSLVIVGDYDFSSLSLLGRLVQIEPTDKSIGVSASLRVISASWTSNDGQNVITYELVQPQARYAKLVSKLIETDTYNIPGAGEIEIPDIVVPPTPPTPTFPGWDSQSYWSDDQFLVAGATGALTGAALYCQDGDNLYAAVWGHRASPSLGATGDGSLASWNTAVQNSIASWLTTDGGSITFQKATFSASSTSISWTTSAAPSFPVTNFIGKLATKNFTNPDSVGIGTGSDFNNRVEFFAQPQVQGDTIFLFCTVVKYTHYRFSPQRNYGTVGINQVWSNSISSGTSASWVEETGMEFELPTGEIRIPSRTAYWVKDDDNAIVTMAGCHILETSKLQMGGGSPFPFTNYGAETISGVRLYSTLQFVNHRVQFDLTAKSITFENILIPAIADISATNGTTTTVLRAKMLAFQKNQIETITNIPAITYPWPLPSLKWSMSTAEQITHQPQEKVSGTKIKSSATTEVQQQTILCAGVINDYAFQATTGNIVVFSKLTTNAFLCAPFGFGSSYSTDHFGYGAIDFASYPTEIFIRGNKLLQTWFDGTWSRQRIWDLNSVYL